MKEKQHSQVVAAIIFNQHGEILLSSRPDDKIFAGFWEFAGGKVETGETPFAALQRELLEETGLHIIDAQYWQTLTVERENAIIQVNFWQVANGNWQGELQARENQQFAWQNPKNITVTPILPSNQPILEALAICDYP